MRLLHLHWPHLLLRLARARNAGSTSFPSGPIVLGGQPWDDATVLDMSPEATAMGVRRGMPLGSAHRLAPEAAFLPPELDAAREAVESALDRLAVLSPGVAGTSDPTDRAFGLLELQLDGLDRLWGDEPRIAARASATVASLLPGTPRGGVADTRFAARIAAGLAASGEVRVVTPGDEVAFLAPLPAALLTADPDVRGRLTRFGLRRIGAVADLPRSALVARFGEEGARIHARARGQEIEPFRPRRPLERLVLPFPVEPPVAELEPLRFVLHRLVGALAAQLATRGEATSRVRLRLALDTTFAPPGTPAALDIDQRLPEPTSEAEAIERLLVVRLEREPPPAPVARLELELDEVAPAAGHQLSLFVPQADRSARLAWQLARLALAFGEDRVRGLEIVDPEAPLAEDRVRWTARGLAS